MRIRLTRKFAELIDGIDLSRRRVGDVIDIPAHDARTLMAEGWAVPDDDARVGRAVHGNHCPADTVADRPSRRRRPQRR